MCGSGLKAVQLGAHAILTGDAEVVIVGGQENMSLAPHALAGSRDGQRMGDWPLQVRGSPMATDGSCPSSRRERRERREHSEVCPPFATPQDTMIKDGLWCAFNDYHMGVTAENVAAQCGVTRAQQDAFAAASQAKAAAAQQVACLSSCHSHPTLERRADPPTRGERRGLQAGRFAEQIVPVPVPQQRRGAAPVSMHTDEYIKGASATPRTLSALKPAFQQGGTVTAGNASGLNDGAAMLLLMSSTRAAALKLTPLATYRAFAAAGVCPKTMGLGPVPASQAALRKAGWSVADVDLVEANEAFAAQACAVNAGMGWDVAKVRVCVCVSSHTCGRARAPLYELTPACARSG